MKTRLTLGGLIVAGSAIWIGQYSADALPDGRRGSDQGGVASIGPDVIVGALPNIARFTTVGGVTAYAVATTSCNIGDTILTWYPDTNQHPVIAQNAFRVKDGRFMQIGIGWLKHGFCALQQNLCGPCTPAGGGCPPILGVGCSDPYSASLNGQQSGLGPRSQVNPSTGFFPYPFSAAPVQNGLSRRIQIANTDLNPTLNPGARWFVEGMYIHPDDSMAGNSANNASYREFTIGSLQSGGYNLNTTGPTVQQLPAIYAWKQVVPAVTIKTVSVPEDGLFFAGFNVTENGDGTYRYEYAIQNLTSDLAGGSLSIPKAPGASVTNAGFHHVNHHSGEPYSNQPWSISIESDAIVWKADRPFTENPNANALRWGTAFSFWFDSDSPPTETEVTLGLFKNGGSIEFAGVAPMTSSAVPGDLNGDGVVDGADLGILLGSWGPCKGGCVADLTGDGQVNGADLGVLLANWG
jgi:hypothetical protein